MLRRRACAHVPQPTGSVSVRRWPRWPFCSPRSSPCRPHLTAVGDRQLPSATADRVGRRSSTTLVCDLAVSSTHTWMPARGRPRRWCGRRTRRRCGTSRWLRGWRHDSWRRRGDMGRPRRIGIGIGAPHNEHEQDLRLLKLVRAGYAACSYSWRTPPRRPRLRILRWPPRLDQRSAGVAGTAVGRSRCPDAAGVRCRTVRTRVGRGAGVAGCRSRFDPAVRAGRSAPTVP